MGICALEIMCALFTSPLTRSTALRQFITRGCFADVVSMLSSSNSSQTCPDVQTLNLMSSVVNLLSAALCDKEDGDDDDVHLL
jgi:hypothetical protein